MLKDFIRQSGPWTTYLAKIKLQNIRRIKNYSPNKTQLSKKVINEFYIKNKEFNINFNNKLN